MFNITLFEVFANVVYVKSECGFHLADYRGAKQDIPMALLEWYKNFVTMCKYKSNVYISIALPETTEEWL